MLDKLKLICSRQEKCCQEIVQLLKKWDVSDDHFEAILNQLTASDFINEQRYARAFVMDKMRFDRWGLIKIRYALRLKGINDEVVSEVLNLVDMLEYRKMVHKELATKMKTIKGNAYEIKAKLFRYGYSRGYEPEIIQEFIGHDSE